MFWYVYEHYDSAGKLFYVGKGKDRRAWTTQGRSTEWQERASKGYSVHIRAAKMGEAEALHLEHELIKLHRPSLVNKLSGGGPLTPRKPVTYNPPPKRSISSDRDDRLNVITRLLLTHLRSRHNPKTAIKDAGRALLRRTQDQAQQRLIQKAMSQVLRTLNAQRR